MRDASLHIWRTSVSSALLIILTTLFFCNCTPTRQSVSVNPSTVNTAHLDALYEEIKMGDHEVGIIHIYSAYPDYHWIGDQDNNFLVS